MNNSITKTLAALVVALAISNIATADPITGSISFSSLGPGFPASGAGSLQGTDPALAINSANMQVSDNGSEVDPTTVFASVTLGSHPVDFATIDLTGTDPAFTAASVVNDNTLVHGALWAFQFAGETYSFTAQSANVVENGTSWTIAGNGFFSGTGAIDYSETAGTYYVTLSQDGDVTQIGSTNSVPDSGATAMLVGLGLLAIVGYSVRRGQVRA